MAAFFHDLRHTGRIFRSAPAFTVTALLILALAIGVNTAMFSILNTWLFRPLHFPHADQLVIVLRRDLSRPASLPYFPFYRDQADWKGRLQSFQSYGGMFWRTFTMTGRGEAESFFGMIVTDGLFETLGRTAELGRVFTAADRAGPPVVVVSHDFWRRRLGGARDVIGRSLDLNGKVYQIVGVMPPSFSLRMENQATESEILALIQPGEPEYDGAGLGPLAIVARLKPGVSIAAAEAELSTLQTAIDARHPDLPRHMGVLLTGMRDDNLRFVRTSLVVLAGAVVFVLLIACANVAGLLLGRGSARRWELAVRSALGSGRARLVAQLLTESLVLAAAGGLAGVLVAYAAVRGFVALNPFDQLPPDSIAVDGRALAFAMALVLAATLLFGAAPALQASRVDLADFLKSRTAAGAPGIRSSRGALAVLQVALSLMLLSGAVLMGKTLLKIHSQPLGFRVDQLMVAQLTLPGHAYGSDALKRNRFYDALLARMAALPGVHSAAIGSVRPLALGPGVNMFVEGREERRDGALPDDHEQVVTPGYFDTLAIPTIEGRKFTDRDAPGSPQVAILSELAAQQLFPGADAIGRRIRIRKDAPWLNIVGVAGDIRTIFYNTLNPKLTPYVYVPARQASQPGFNPVGQDAYLFVRATSPVSMPILRREVDAIDRDVPVGELMSMNERVAKETSQPRMRAGILGGFAAVALLLAAIGIYGLIAQSVAQRTGEIGIRMALGARPGDVLVMVVRQALAIAAAGIALGVAGGLALARVLSGFLYGIAATDGVVYVAVAITVLLTASIAAYFPARRASQVDPLVALRDE